MFFASDVTVKWSTNALVNCVGVCFVVCSKTSFFFLRVKNFMLVSLVVVLKRESNKPLQCSEKKNNAPKIIKQHKNTNKYTEKLNFHASLLNKIDKKHTPYESENTPGGTGRQVYYLVFFRQY